MDVMEIRLKVCSCFDFTFFQIISWNFLKGCRWAGREAMGNTHPRCKAASLEVWVTVCFS